MKKLNTIKTFTITTILLLTLSACSTNGTARRNGSSSDTYYGGTSIEQLIESTDLDAAPAPDEDISTKIVRKSHKVPKVINEEVKKWITYFTKTNPSWFQRALTRSEEFETNMKNILISNDVPEELFYLALIESGFVRHSRSHAGAQGIWQFMKGTGRLYGLRVDRKVDERLDPYKATAAAASYLKDLYNIYGSWYLAIASYNAGEGRIRSAILRHRERDFWELADKNALPEETMNYVPKYIAAVIVAENYDKFGFAYNGPSKEGIIVDEDLKTMFAVDQFRRGSSHTRRAVDSSAYASYEAKKSSSSTVATVSPQAASTEQEVIAFHKVRRGDNLSTISRKYGVNLSQLRACNSSLKSSDKIAIGQRIKLVCDEGPEAPKLAVSSGEGDSVRPAKKTTVYRVRKGDTLERISKKYDVSIDHIKECNPTVKRYTILAGQKLKINCPSPSDQPARDYIVHTVRRGDNLSKIASRYGVSVKNIIEWNNIRNKSVIFKGRKLRIYNKNNSSELYVKERTT